ncbi:hypothetical protein BDR26DRAFT_879573 [Obelidium mucronatum]|nr:hypothetical protein BDR26DRAFT_879573 [Obelidium mucronatum]
MKKRFHELKAKFNAAAQQEHQQQQQQQTQKHETVAVAGDEKVAEEIVVESVSEVPEATTECSVAEDVKDVAPKENVLESVEIAAVVSVEEPVELVAVTEDVEEKTEVVETVAVSEDAIVQISVIQEPAVVVSVESEQVLTPVSPAKSEDAVEESEQREAKPEPEVGNMDCAVESEETAGVAEEPNVVAEVIAVELVDVSASAKLIESVETFGPETCAESLDAPALEVIESVDSTSAETSVESIDTPTVTPAIESVDVLPIETSVDSVDVSAPVVPSAPDVITEVVIPESAVVADVPREAIVSEESIAVLTSVYLNESEAIIVEDEVDINDFYGGDAVQEKELIVESQANEQLVEPRLEESAVVEKEKESGAPETDVNLVNGLLSHEAELPVTKASTLPQLSTQPHQEYLGKVVADDEVVVVAEEEVVIADAPATIVTTPAYVQSRASSIYSPQNYDPDQEYPAISELNVHFRNSILDNDLEVQVIRMRGQVERTRILINEQLRLRNLPPLMPGQYTLQPTSPLSPVHRTQQQDGKRNSIISSISQRVVNVFSSVSGSTSPVPAAPTPSGSASTPTTPATPVPPAPTPQEEELRAMREELERTKKEIAEKMEKNKILLAQQQQQLQQQQGGFVPFVPAPPPSSSSPAPQRAAGSKPTDEFPGVHQVIEPKKAAKDADSTSVTSGKSGKSAKSTKSSGWSMFRSKSNKNLKEESSADGKPVARRKSIKESKPEAPPMMMMNQHMLGRF